MRLTTTIMRDWLRARIPAELKTVVGTGKIADMQDKVILITKAGSGKDINNGLFEKQTYRFFCRGVSNSVNSAEKLAIWVTEELEGIENYDMKFEDVDIRILGMKANGVPRQLTITDSQSRFQFAVEIDVTSSTD